MTVPPLAGVEAHALGLLMRVASVLRWRGVPNPEAVIVRVVNRHLPGTDSETARQIDRAEKAEHRVRLLEARLARRAAPPKPTATGPRTTADGVRIVALSPREAVVLEHLKAGHRYKQIGAELDMSVSNVQTTVHRLVRWMQAADKSEAIDMACTGRVRIEVQHKRRGVAA